MAVNILRDIHSVSVFKRDASKLLKQLKETKQPLVLTVNGKADAVVLDAESYQRLVATKDYADTVTVLKERIQELRNGAAGIPIDEAFAQLAQENGFTLAD